MDLAVLGGGISGLASARRLAQRGHRITLYEADGRLGGLGGTFCHDGIELEKFYHCLLPADAARLRHVEELGLASLAGLARFGGDAVFATFVLTWVALAFSCARTPRTA